MNEYFKKMEEFRFDDFQGDISFRSQLNKYLKRVSYVFYMNLAGVLEVGFLTFFV